MKPLLLALSALLLAASCAPYTVTSVRSTPSQAAVGGLLYALPRTELCIDVTFSFNDTATAPFAAYAEEMVAQRAVAAYTIDTVAIAARVVPDPSHYYFVHPRRLAIQVGPDNLLRSVGLSAADAAQLFAHQQAAAVPSQAPSRPRGDETRLAENNLYDRIDTFYTPHDRPGHPSLLSARKDARSLRQRAQAAAERLGQLQERRQQLLDGDLETSYAPETVRLMLQLVEQQERQLIDQFLGTPRRTTLRFVVDPKDEKAFIDDQTVTLFYFSPLTGLADSADASAEAVRCNVRCVNNLRNAARFVRYRAAASDQRPNDRNTLKYRRSEQADVSVFSSRFRYDEQLPVAQFGPVVELPGGAIQALFSPATGDLIYLSK